MTLGSPLALFFLVLANDQNSSKVIVFQYFSMVWNRQTTIEFPNVFPLIYHFVSKPLPGAIFRGSQCWAFIPNWFWVPFSIFIFFKKHPLDYLFAKLIQQKKTDGPGRTSTDPVFHETILITVPFGPSVFWKVIFVDKDSLISCFCLLFFVLCFI